MGSVELLHLDQSAVWVCPEPGSLSSLRRTERQPPCFFPHFTLWDPAAAGLREGGADLVQRKAVVVFSGDSAPSCGLRRVLLSLSVNLSRPDILMDSLMLTIKSFS